MKTVLAGSLVAFLSGCSVAVLDDAPPAHSENACSAESECGGGVCEDGACRAREGTFRSVLFEVIPPADARAIAGVRFLKRIDDLDPRGGYQDLVLDRVAQVSGYVHAEKAPEQQCAFPASVPARVTFTPTEPVLGLSAGVYTTVTGFKNLVSGSAGETQGHVFELSLPPGVYDVYVQDAADESPPQGEAAAPTPACRLVPTLLRSVPIEAGRVIMSLPVDAPARLDVTVQLPVPGAQDLSGWTIDMLDPSSGKVVSTKAVLSQPAAGRYKSTLYYSAVGDALKGHELVRLTPPENSNAPMVVLERSALELFTVGEALIDQVGAFPTPIRVQGQVERVGSSDPISASLSLIASEIHQLEPGTLASFRRTLQTDSEGRFEVQLLPGTYTVQATPAAASGAAATQTDLEIRVTPEVQAGRVIEVKDLARLEGRVNAPTGRPVFGASIHAAATPASSLVRLLDAALGAQPFVPRASACSGRSQSCVPVTEADGHFSIEADPGLFDMSVRTPDDAGFAWFVRPRVQIAEQSRDLGSITLPLPVVYRGRLTAVETGLVPGALIRAYVYVDSNGNVLNPNTGTDMSPKSVLQVAETRADDDGSFELRLPARLQ
jgi:hypothetical protein